MYRNITQSAIKIIKAVNAKKNFEEIERILEHCVLSIIKEEKEKLLEKSTNIERTEIPRCDYKDEHGLRHFALKTCDFQGVMVAEEDGYWIPFNDVLNNLM